MEKKKPKIFGSFSEMNDSLESENETARFSRMVPVEHIKNIRKLQQNGHPYTVLDDTNFKYVPGKERQPLIVFRTINSRGIETIIPGNVNVGTGVNNLRYFRGVNVIQHVEGKIPYVSRNAPYDGLFSDKDRRIWIHPNRVDHVEFPGTWEDFWEHSHVETFK